MTMQIRIENGDEVRVATVTVEAFKIGNPLPVSSDKRTLKPHEWCEVHIHASKRVIVTEEP